MRTTTTNASGRVDRKKGILDKTGRAWHVGLGKKEAKGENMSKKKSICAACKYHFTEPTSYGIDDHYCKVKAKDVTDYVTGFTEAEGILNCYDINKNGDCPDFEKLIDYVRQKRMSE